MEAVVDLSLNLTTLKNEVTDLGYDNRALMKMRKVCADVQQLILFRADIIRRL